MRPVGPYRMPPPQRDGILRRRDGVLARLLHSPEGEPVLVRAWAAGGCVRIRAEAGSREAAAHGAERMRFGLALDHDISEFHHRFKTHRLLGPVIRRRPWIRPRRHAEPYEALAWAVTEQLIDSDDAAEIQRRLTRRYGRRSACGAWRDSPSAAALAGRAPVELEACGLSAARALALVRASREVAAGRADLSLHEPAWRRLRAIPGIGPWTVEKLALEGLGRDDQLPAGDLAFIKLVGRLEGLGRRATEEEVREYFAPYAPFQALAGVYLLNAARAILRDAPPPWVRTAA